MFTASRSTTKSLEETLVALRDRAVETEIAARAERVEAERALKLARGTGDVHEKAAAAVRHARGAPAPSLAEKIEAVLRGPFAPLDLRAIAAAVQEPAGRVGAHLKKLREMPCPTRSRDDANDARQVYNLGTADDPRWIWVVGDETTPEELHAVVKKLVSSRPSGITFAELTAATGARRGRLSGRLVQLQRDGEPIRNVGSDERTYRWFLAPKRKRRSTNGATRPE